MCSPHSAQVGRRHLSSHRYRVKELYLEEEEQAIQPSEPILSFSWNISNCHYLKLFPLVSRFHGPGRVPHSFVRTFFQLSPTVWFYVKSTLFCFLPGGICTPSVLCMVANAWTSLTQHSRPIEAKLTQPVFMLYRRCCIYLNVIRLSKFSLRWHYTLHISVLLHHPL